MWGQIGGCFGIGIIKIYLIGSIVLVLKKHPILFHMGWKKLKKMFKNNLSNLLNKAGIKLALSCQISLYRAAGSKWWSLVAFQDYPQSFQTWKYWALEDIYQVFIMYHVFYHTLNHMRSCGDQHP